MPYSTVWSIEIVVLCEATITPCWRSTLRHSHHPLRWIDGGNRPISATYLPLEPSSAPYCESTLLCRRLSPKGFSAGTRCEARTGLVSPQSEDPSSELQSLT